MTSPNVDGAITLNTDIHEYCQTWCLLKNLLIYFKIMC